MNFPISVYAVQQYVARVKPAIEAAQAKREMELLLNGASCSTVPPAWTRPHPEHTGSRYVIVSPGIAFAIGRDGLVTTVLTRGSTSSARRAARNKRKRELKAARKKAARQFHSRTGRHEKGRRASWD
jgi:hypothetical protein